MSRRWWYLGSIAALALVGGAGLTTLNGRAASALASRNPPFTLATVDRCFLASPPPRGTVWPLAPVSRAHAIRGSFNGPRGTSPHFGVDVDALTNKAAVYAISSGFVSAINRRARHFSIKIVGQNHFIQYWHVRPLDTLRVGTSIRAGQSIGHVQKAYYHVHVGEFDSPCGWINPMRPSGPLNVRANTERPNIGSLAAYVANRAAFRPFPDGTNPALQTDPSTPVQLTDLHGVVDLRAEIHDWPEKKMVERPQLELEPAAIRAYLAPKFNPYEHVSQVKHVYDGAILLDPARLGTTIWHIWAFGTWREDSGYFDSGPHANSHLGAAYVWHVGGIAGLDTTQYPNGAYQYCIDALTINGRSRTRCTQVVINN
jgi:hypothetical protein